VRLAIGWRLAAVRAQFGCGYGTDTGPRGCIEHTDDTPPQHQRSPLGRRLSRVGTTAGLPITRKVRVGVVVAAIIAGMLVLMGIINDIETGLHDLNQTSQK